MSEHKMVRLVLVVFFVVFAMFSVGTIFHLTTLHDNQGQLLRTQERESEQLEMLANTQEGQGALQERFLSLIEKLTDRVEHLEQEVKDAKKAKEK